MKLSKLVLVKFTVRIYMHLNLVESSEIIAILYFLFLFLCFNFFSLFYFFTIDNIWLKYTKQTKNNNNNGCFFDLENRLHFANLDCSAMLLVTACYNCSNVLMGGENLCIHCMLQSPVLRAWN